MSPLPPTIASLFVHTTDPLVLASALDAARRRGRYELFSGPIPRDYPRPSPEIRELCWRTDADSGWAVVLLEELDRAHHWGRELTEATPGLVAWSLRAGAFGRWSAKLYRGGHPVAKVGQDDDRELFYPVPPAATPQFEEAERWMALPPVERARFRRWWQGTPDGTATAESLSLALGWPYSQVTFHQARADSGWTAECWVRRGSRLLLG